MQLNQRSCLPCTACCEGWLDINEPDVQAHLGKPCTHCSSAGCSIYETRPLDPCQTFFCAWRQDSTPLIEQMRPDLSGVIVVMDRLRWRGQSVTVGIPTGQTIPDQSHKYLMGLSQLTQTNLLTVRLDVVDGKFMGTSWSS